MIANVIHFLGYMFFSSLEYFAIFLLIFSFFRLYPEHYKREITYLTLATTFVSYVLVMFNIYKYVPLPIIIAPVVIYILKKILSRNLAYSIVSTVFGFVFYLAMQSFVAYLAVSMKMITPEEITNPFILNNHILQCLCASITIAIAMYIKIFNGGFAFSFSTSNKSYVNFTYITVFIGVIAILNCLAFTITKTYSFIILMACASIVSVFIISYFSNKRDGIEFS